MTDFQNSRTNQQWLDELRGKNGAVQQAQAHRDLATILFPFAYHYLRQRQRTSLFLTAFAAEEIAEMAKDFVQETMEKLTANNFAKAETIREEGKFVNWCRRFLINVIAGELRHSYWKKRGENEEEQEGSTEQDPERLAQISYLQSIITACLDKLPDRQRSAFEQSIVHDVPANQIAQTMGIQESAVYQLIYRARNTLRACVKNKGIGSEVLSLFD